MIQAIGKAGVGRQYIGEIGKTDNGIVVVTIHLYDGKKVYR
jgi:SRSO17 transposase